MATTAAFAVPVVDIACYLHGSDAQARAATAQALDRAAREVGFMQLSGHGVAEDTLAGLTDAIDAVFALPAEVKAGCRTPPDINRGYSPPESESLSLSLGLEASAGLNDYFEAFNIGTPASAFPGLDLPAQVYAENVWPPARPGFDAERFRNGVQTYFGEAGRVARTLGRIIADALGVDPQLIQRATDHSVDVLRLVHYALPAGRLARDPDPTGMGAHTDYGIVTVLWADPVPGLQVLGHDGVWHDVQPAPGCLLVNLGDLAARWTGDRWLSTLHRVKPPVVDGRTVRRRSAAYFHDGNIDALIQTLPGCQPAEGPGYPPITVAGHLAAKLAGSRGGRANDAAGNEAGRVLAAGL